MVQLWASGLLLAFVWSIVLYLLAISGRGRKQETGALYAVAGLVLYVLAFADRLPGSPTGVRSPLRSMPQLESADVNYTSSLLLLLLSSIIYSARVVVFLELLPTKEMIPGPDTENVETLNDYLAPILTFASLAVCFVALTTGIYDLTWPWFVGLAIMLFAIYFYRVLDYVVSYIEALAKNLRALVKGIWKPIKRFFRTLPIQLVEFLAWFEGHRPASPESTKINSWLEAWIAELDDPDRDFAEEDRERLRAVGAKLAANRNSAAGKKSEQKDEGEDNE